VDFPFLEFNRNNDFTYIYQTNEQKHPTQRAKSSKKTV